jgi:hypothetical protein
VKKEKIFVVLVVLGIFLSFCSVAGAYYVGRPKLGDIAAYIKEGTCYG